MAGVKGKSGKASTPAHRQAKRMAGQAGGNAKAGRAPNGHPRGTTGGTTGGTEGAGKGAPPETVLPVTPGAAFKVDCWMAYKDYLECELRKRKILEADIDVETAATKRDQGRGKLLTYDQVRARDERHTDAFRRSILSAADLLPKWVPADKILAAQVAMREWADQQLAAVADQVKSG